MSEEPKRWLVRERIDMDTAILNGVAKHKKTYELVWGRWEREKEHKNGQKTPAKIIGESYHELHGPTAFSSMSSFAEDLNMRNVPPSKIPVFKKPNNSKNDPNQPFLSLTGADLGKTKPKK